MNFLLGQRFLILLIALVFALGGLSTMGCWPDDGDEEDEDEEEEDTGELCAIPSEGEPNTGAGQDQQEEESTLPDDDEAFEEE